MTITSEELNFLVFRYLQESGFQHSAFTLGYEACLNKHNINGNNVPPGALISFIQKGLQYLELEVNLSEAGTEAGADFSVLQPADLLTKDAAELRVIVRERRSKREKEKEKEKEKEQEKDQDKDREKERELERERERDKDKERGKDKDNDRERGERGREKQERLEKDSEAREVEKEAGREEKRQKVEEEKPASKQPSTTQAAVDVVTAPDVEVVVEEDIKQEDVQVLEGHQSEVFVCAWSPTANILASGAGDSTARIWTFPEGPSPSSKSPTRPVAPKATVLKHFKGGKEKSKDVTTLDWSGDGEKLATGSYDGQARIWSRSGELLSTLTKHKGPIFSLKWNKKGDYLLSGSVDKTTIVWDARMGEVKQQCEFHKAPALDVDWKNNTTFATCSTDQMIYVCKIGENRPIKTFAGHQDEVNAIKWDPNGVLLASCSDDYTAKLWSIKNDKCVHSLTEHEKEIYTIKWSPTGPGTANPNLPLVLASASFDSTCKVWDIEKGATMYSLTRHKEPVYSVTFSPNGEYLATGSFDKWIYIWAAKDGQCVKTYAGKGGVFEICWNKDGDKLAACYSNNTVCVLDFRK